LLRLSNNTAGSVKCSLAIAYYISVSNIDSIIVSYISIESEVSGYLIGFGLLLIFSVLGVVAALGLYFIYRKINNKRDLIL
jgi:hypothetical protein